MSSCDAQLFPDRTLKKTYGTMGAEIESTGVSNMGDQTGHDSEHGAAPPNKFLSVFRSVPFQVLIACGVSFTAPGMWDAINNVGSGGAAEPYAVSAANALVYGLFFLVCIAAGAINNRIGLRYGLALGAIGYPIYGAGLYVNNTQAVTWFMLFGSALCGISAGFFWAAEAAIIIGYPSPKDRAFYLAIWQTAKAAGPIIGGAINLSMNANQSGAGSISPSTYVAFIVIMYVWSRIRPSVVGRAAICCGREGCVKKCYWRPCRNAQQILSAILSFLEGRLD